MEAGVGTVSASDTEGNKQEERTIAAGCGRDSGHRAQRHTIRPTGVSLNARVTCPSSSGTRRP